jgi:MFS family permease
MSVLADPSVAVLTDDRLARRNALLLAGAQALAGANNTVIVVTAGIIGSMYAPDKGLATLPISVMILAMALGTLPTGWLARNYGRRFSLQVGSAIGTIAGFVTCWAVLQGSFWLFTVGAFGCGLYSSAHQSYRFAATDTASDAFKPKAVSWVLAGGVVSAVLGPQLVIFTKDLWAPYLFAATFIAQAMTAALAGCVLTFLKIPHRVPDRRQDAGRPLSEIARSPMFVVAVACGVASYSMMNMVMTSAPLAMVGCGHSVTDATLGVQWHVLGMFGPSFITGSLIVRFGVQRIVITGLALLLVAAAIGIHGITVAHFWIGLAVLGIGWNFAFIGATTLVTRCHRPEERNKVQSFNDFLVFGAMAIGSFSSGKLLATVGWASLNGVVFPVVLAAAGLLCWLMLRQRARAA